MSDNQEPKYIITRSPKSLGIGLILTLFLGPLGLLYATVRGGIIMIITVPLVNFICMIWAYVSIKRYNENLFAGKPNV